MVNLLRLKLENFAGIYTATGLKTLEINREKSKNNIVLILGNNGSGKSSLLNEITLLPLENVEGRNESRIIKGKDGLKEIDLVKDKEWLYKISIQYPANKTTKCYIKKKRVGSDEEIDLNPNGNVSSYMETIYNELGITKCYTNIGYLSSSVSNFLQMKPSERNSFISEWISDIDTFLEGYKNVSKKSFHIKKEIDIMNRDIGRIDSANNEIRLNEVGRNISDIESRIENVTVNHTKLNTYLEQISPRLKDVDLYMRKSIFLERTNDLKKMRDEIYRDAEFVNSISKTNESNESVIDKIGKNKVRIEMLNNTVIELKERLYKLKIYISETVEEVSSKYDICSDYTLSELIEQIRELEITRKSLEPLSDIQFEISKDIDISHVIVIENLLYDIYHKLKECEFDKNMCEINYISTHKSNLIKERDLINKEYTINKEKIDEINSRIYSYRNSVIDKNILKLKPEECNFKCGIVNELLNYFESGRIVPILENESNGLLKNNHDIEMRLESISNELSKLDSFESIISYIDKAVYNNLKYMEFYPDVFMNIINTDSYNISRNILRLIDINKDIKEYASVESKKRSIDSSLLGLKNTYSMLLNKTKLNESITEKTNEINEVNDRISEYVSEIEFLEKTNKTLENIKEYRTNLEKKIEDYNMSYNSLVCEKKELIELNEYSYIYKHLKDLLSRLDSEKIDLMNELVSLRQEKEKLTSIVISKQQIENMRNKSLQTLEKYNILSEIWSPKVGYPSWKIKNFTNMLTEETNKDLEEMWGDDLRINEIRIGSNEFTIEIDRNGTIIGDAIACSSGEQATLALALSFAIIKMNLKNIAYNIIRLDELDGPFDVERRTGFIDIVNSRLDDLNCQTCFIVSHNNEFDSVDCDVILLKGWKNIPMRMDNKNVLLSV